MKNRMILFFIVLFLHANCFNAISQTTPQPFDWDEYNKNSISLGGLQFTPDGDFLLFSTRKADFETNRWINKNQLMDMKSKKITELTFDQKGVRNVRWSPAGKYLSYIAGINDQNQIVIQEFPHGKSEVISNHKTGVSSFYWSPDEIKIAFIARDEKPRKPESETSWLFGFSILPFVSFVYPEHK